ncbi:MAG TPA: EamA family transporter [Solirubrobacteraceae bacterium]|nr:EamA family transporter [Solirubrobacteraceae bacterium]
MHTTAVVRWDPLSWRTATALTTVYLAWGGTYVAIRVMVETLPPLISTGARFLIAGALLGAWLRARGRRLRASRRELLGAAAIGTVILGDIGLLAVAEREVPAGLAALLIATVPLWVVALRLAAGERMSHATLAGVLLGLAGVALLVLPGDRPEGAPLGWLLVLVGAAAIEAAGQFASQRTPLPRDLLWTTALQLLAAGAVLVLAGAATGEVAAGAGRVSTESAVAFGYLVLPGSILAYSAFVWLLEHEPVSTVATYAYVNPVVALVLGWLVLGEGLTATMAAGSVVVVGSVAFVVRRESG